jgi:hypothetical protein
MTIPKALLRIVRRKIYAEAKIGHRRGGKNFPPKKSEMFGIYKLFSDAYKRRRYPDMYYIARAILHFARSRSFTKLAQLASFERRFGNQRLGFLLQNAIRTLGVGAMRELDFDGEQVTAVVPKTWASSK